MADAAATIVINKAVDIATNQIVKTTSRLYRLQEDTNWIERQMRRLKSYLKDAEAKEAISNEVANLIIDIRDLALDIEDLLDTYLQEMASHKRKDVPFGYLKRVACLCCYGATANTFALEIEKIKKRAQELEAVKESCSLIATEDGGNIFVESWNQRKQFLHYNKFQTVGRDEILQSLREEMLSENLQCKMISIVGHAGAGKTTIAKRVYRDIKNKFDCSALVYVSQEPRVREVLLEIAKQVGLTEQQTKDELEKNLCKFLEEKMFLIFLDDIWSVDIWKDLVGIIPTNSMNGSRIIVTSRYTNVGRYIGKWIKLELLNEEISWELFSNLIEYPPRELEDIGRKIVERCGGLPLAIVVVAGMLRQRERTRREWNDIRTHMNEGAEDECLKVLSLSYKHLPIELRPFFLYLGLFPEDHEISVSDLTEAWVAEKLINADEARKHEGIVQRNLALLVDRNLVQVSKRRWDGSIISCRIHDLIHNLCVWKAKESNFFYTFGNIDSTSTSALRRLTINNDSFASGLSSNYKVHKLRSLLCFNASGNEFLGNIEKVISNFQFLRFLIIEVGNSKDHILPYQIGNMSGLAYLKLKGLFVSMPRSIKNLEKLLTLDIAGMNCYHTWDYMPLPPNLETLDGINGASVDPESLAKFTNLRKLNIKNITIKLLEVLSAPLPVLEKLQDLKLETILSCSNPNLTSYKHLVKLHLFKVHDRYEKSKTICEYPPSLLELTLEDCLWFADPMELSKELPKLQILNLTSCVFCSDLLDCSGMHSFPELQTLLIVRSCFSKLIVDEEGMPKLSSVVYEPVHEQQIFPEKLRKISIASHNGEPFSLS